MWIINGQSRWWNFGLESTVLKIKNKIMYKKNDSFFSIGVCVSRNVFPDIRVSFPINFMAWKSDLKKIENIFDFFLGDQFGPSWAQVGQKGAIRFYQPSKPSIFSDFGRKINEKIFIYN